MAQLETARDHEDAQLRIYRALPEQYDEINTGDWVTLSRDYAEQHASDEGWPVVYADVPAHQVFTDGNDLAEFGYTGPKLDSLPQLREGTETPAPVRRLGRTVERGVGEDHPHDSTPAERFGDLSARVNAMRDELRRAADTAPNPRAGAAQRWDDGPTAHGQAPAHHQ